MGYDGGPLSSAPPLDWRISNGIKRKPGGGGTGTYSFLGLRSPRGRGRRAAAAAGGGTKNEPPSLVGGGLQMHPIHPSIHPADSPPWRVRV